MRRSILIILALGMIAISVAGCGADLATTNTAPDTDQLMPAVGDGGPLSEALLEYVKSCDWVEIDFAYPAGPDSLITVVPKGYPASQPVTISIRRDPAILGAGERGTIWVPAPTDSRTATSVPGGCLVVRTRNVPAAGADDVKVHLPVGPWQDTVNWNGDFNVYRRDAAAASWVAYPDGGPTAAQWPDGNSYSSLCLTLAAFPDKDGSDGATDHLVEPSGSGGGY